MRYFSGGEDESSQEEIETFFEKKDEQDRFMEMVDLGLAKQEIAQRHIDLATRLCEKSFFWRFCSIESKLGRIAEVAAALAEMTE